MRNEMIDNQTINSAKTKKKLIYQLDLEEARGSQQSLILV
jgi:hypothetical protein